MRTLNLFLISKDANYKRIRMMIVVSMLVFCYLGLRDFLDYRYKQLHDKPPARVLENDIVIPFELKNGNIALLATIEGIKIKGIFDTGGSSTEINSSQIHPFTTFIPEGEATIGSGGGGVALQSGFFPQVNINGVNFDHVGCYLSYSEKSPLVSFVDGEPHQFSIGNDFFYDYVITINYPNQLLILRKNSYDITKVQTGNKSTLLDASYICNNGGTIPEYILMPGYVGGKATKILLDLGNYIDGMIIDPRYLRNSLRVASKAIVPSIPCFENRKIELETDPIIWKIGSLTGKCKSFVLDNVKSLDPIYDQIDVNIGSDQLRDCCVTIDYKRKKVLIERTVDIRNADFSLKTDIKPFCGNQPAPAPHLPGSNLRWDQKPDGSWHEIPID